MSNIVNMSNSAPTSSKNSIRGVIDRFEGSYAVIKTDDGQTLNWSTEKLPLQAKEGSVISLQISDDVKADEERTKLAKSLLNEIFTTSK